MVKFNYEITELRKDNLDDIISSLLKSKKFITEIGRGHAIAFELKDGNVLKCWVFDPGYEFFIDYCIKHKNDPWFIKPLSKVKIFTLPGIDQTSNFNKIKCIKLEKLTSANNFSIEKYNPPANETIKSVIWMIKHSLSDGYMSYNEMISLYDIYPSDEFKNLLKELYNRIKIFQEDGWSIDVKVNNMGLRGDQIVIMDPITDEFGMSNNKAIYLKDYLKGKFNETI